MTYKEKSFNSRLMLKMNLHSFFSLILLFSPKLLNCAEFNRQTTGIEFSAYVKKTENGIRPGWKTYTMDDVKTMLEVISTKFSRINTYGVGVDNVKYVPNVTYYDRAVTNGQTLTSEAAARLNDEKGQKLITVIPGIWVADDDQQMDAEVNVALESSEIANNIYSGTIEGLVFSHHEIGTSLERTNRVLRWMKTMKDNATMLGLKVGTRQKCYGLTSSQPEDPTSSAGKLLLARQEILNTSDFIICEAEPAAHNLGSGADNAFLTVGRDLLRFRDDFALINANLEVMGQTKWASRGDHPWENIKNFGDYWIEADKWASKNNFQMWLLEAFDNEWKNWDSRSAHYGWWRLRSNNMTNRLDGYAEKIYEPEEEPQEPVVKPPVMHDKHKDPISPWIYVGAAIGILVLLLIIAVVTMLFMRVKQLTEALTKEDIKEFMYGMNENALGQGDGIMESALKFPYDKSYEIPKEKLKIKQEQLLGTGQFGCVYRALIDDDEKTEVALKMAKHNCPKSALKGLLSEIKILTYLGKHPNIVSIHGAYTAEIMNGIVFVATELCPLGSLESYLRNAQTGVNQDRYANAPALNANSNYQNADNREIKFKEMIRWSHEIACGMEYLGTKHVVHADLATRNVLLAADRTAKITDFGLSRRLYDYTNYVKQQQEPLPWRWMSIESLKRLEFSSKSDVWSMGVTMWEIFALGDLPYPGLSWNLEFVDNLVSGLRMKCPPHATPEVYKIMVDCWHMDPKERPTFTDLKLSTGELMTRTA